MPNSGRVDADPLPPNLKLKKVVPMVGVSMHIGLLKSVLGIKGKEGV
jgi:hypothetical protein